MTGNLYMVVDKQKTTKKSCISCSIHIANYGKYAFCNTILSYMNKKHGPQGDQRVGLTKSKQVHLFRQMREHTYFVTLSAAEIGCLCEHDGLRVLSQRLIVCNCVRESVSVYVQPSMSDQASFTRILNFVGVLFPDPIRYCQRHKLNIYSVSLLPALSLLVTLPLSSTYSTQSLHSKMFFP